MTTLGRLVDTLSPHVLTVACAPRGLEVPVAEVVVHDLADPIDIGMGDLVLGVGLSSTPAALDLLQRMGEARASGLLLKMTSAEPSLITAATQADVALFCIPAGAAWAQLVSLIRSALALGDFESVAESLDGVAAGDLFGLANMVATLLDAPITIEDTQSRVIAYSRDQEKADAPRIATILGRRVPEPIIRRLREDGAFRRLSSSRQPIFFDAGEAAVMPRAAVAIRAGDEVLGWMWAAITERLSPDKEKAFADAAGLVAIHLLRHRMDADLSRRIHANLTSSVLEGRPGSEDAAERLLLEGESFRVLAAWARADETADNQALHMRLWDLLALHLSAVFRRTTIAPIGSVVYAVISTSRAGEAERRRILEVARTFAAHAAPSLHCTPLIGIGGRASCISDIPRSRVEADQALRVLQTYPPASPAAEIEDVRMQTLLLRLREFVTDEQELRGGRLGVLLDYDAQHGTDYVETLHVYLDAFGDIAAAAAKLCIHANTLRYRLRKLQEIAEIQLDNPNERLALMLQLQLLITRAS